MLAADEQSDPSSSELMSHRSLSLLFLFTLSPLTGISQTAAPFWTDSQTHLTWAATDNGSGVTLNQAEYYCRNLTLGGHKDWSLASIDDLQHLFGGEPDTLGHHVIGPIKLTGWVWSSSPGKAPGEEWALDFGDGGRASVVTGDSGLNRALCVRREK